MPDDPIRPTAEELHPWLQYRLAIFISGAVLIAFVIVLVAMGLYNASGTALLDLSRPGYQEQRGQVEESKSLKAFEPTGDLDNEAISEFRTLYDERVDRAAEWAFSDDRVLSDEALGIAEPAE